MGAACRSLRYELLMFLFAFEVNDAQDTCTCKCSYGDSGIQEKRRLIAGLTGGATGGVVRFFRKLLSCVRSDLHPSDPHGKQSHARFSVCIVELFKDNHILSGKSRSVEGKGNFHRAASFFCFKFCLSGNWFSVFLTKPLRFPYLSGSDDFVLRSRHQTMISDRIYDSLPWKQRTS